MVVYSPTPRRMPLARPPPSYPSILWSFGSAAIPLPPPPDFRILFATPLNSNTVRVFFSVEPKRSSALAEDDVLLRTNWQISILTGPGKVPIVTRVENPLPQPAIDPLIPAIWSVDVRVGQRLLAATTYLIVGSTSILSADLAAALVSPYDRDDFPGDHVPRARAPASPPGVRANADIRYDFFQGVWILDAASDLDLHAGVEALKKRILRRLLTRPGGFFHLPDYGVGLRSKGPLNTTELSRLRSRILDQVQREEEVDRVQVTLANIAPNVLLISLKIRARGIDFGLELESQEDGRIFV